MELKTKHRKTATYERGERIKKIQGRNPTHVSEGKWRQIKGGKTPQPEGKSNKGTGERNQGKKGRSE